MSTKCSLVYSDDLHFYTDFLQPDFVFLQLKNGYINQTISIPLHIWEVIRKCQLVKFDWADKTDKEILDHVVKEVEERLEELKEAKTKQERALICLFGSVAYGDAEEPKEKQIELGVEYYQKERERQLNIRKDMEKLKVVDQE